MKQQLPRASAFCVAFTLACNLAAVCGADSTQNALLSPEAVQAQVDALKKEDVAWRKIAWKTCLLDGLATSREQNKPIVLWIFIDRPIDDERC